MYVYPRQVQYIAVHTYYDPPLSGRLVSHIPPHATVYLIGTSRILQAIIICFPHFTSSCDYHTMKSFQSATTEQAIFEWLLTTLGHDCQILPFF